MVTMKADKTRQTNKGDNNNAGLDDSMRANRGLNYFDMGDYEKSIEYYNGLIKDDPDDDELYFWRGRAYREAALAEKRQNDNRNTEKSLSYFRKSDEDYQKAEELSGQ